MEDMHIHLKEGINNYEIMKKYIDRCIELGINKVVFLDHGNRISPKHIPVLNSDEVIFEFFRLIDKLREEYKNIRIFKGIEVDYSFDSEFRKKELEIMNKGFDVVLGSIHSMKDLTKEEYYKAVLKLLDDYPIGILCHLKLDENYLDYDNLLRKIVEKCSKNRVYMEINTANRSIWSKEQLEYMMKLFIEYDIKYTIGSDAHKIEEIGTNFDLINSNLEKVKECLYSHIS